MTAIPTPVPRAKQQRNSWGVKLLIGLVFGYVGLLILLPVGALLFGAFSQGFGVVTATFSDPDVQAAIALTLHAAAIATAINGVFGFIVAWVLTRSRFPGRRLIMAIVDLPLALSPIVGGYIFILLFGRLSPLAPLENTLNLSIVFDVPGVVIATIFVTLPLMIRELLPVIAALDREQEHAAATLGAHGWQSFWLVTFPAVRWGVIYGLTLTFARAIGEFGAVLVVGGGVQGSTETATLFIARALNDRNYGGAEVVALLLGAFSLALIFGIEQLRSRASRSART